MTLETVGLTEQTQIRIEAYQEHILAALQNHMQMVNHMVSQRYSKLLLQLCQVKSVTREVMQHAGLHQGTIDELLTYEQLNSQ